jgi:hypothetical protein
LPRPRVGNLPMRAEDAFEMHASCASTGG